MERPLGGSSVLIVCSGCRAVSEASNEQACPACRVRLDLDSFGLRDEEAFLSSQDELRQAVGLARLVSDESARLREWINDSAQFPASRGVVVPFLAGVVGRDLKESVRTRHSLRIGLALLGGFVVATALVVGLDLLSILNSGALRGLVHIAVWAFVAWMLWPTSRSALGDRRQSVCEACGAVNHGSWPTCYACKALLVDATVSD